MGGFGRADGWLGWYSGADGGGEGRVGPTGLGDFSMLCKERAVSHVIYFLYSIFFSLLILVSSFIYRYVGVVLILLQILLFFCCVEAAYVMSVSSIILSSIHLYLFLLLYLFLMY